MGLTAAGALLAILLAYLSLSPRALIRLGLSSARFDLRVREFVGYALALLMLMFGFFLAGVPLGTQAQPTAVALEPTLSTTAVAMVSSVAAEDAAVPSATPTLSVVGGSDSGAFGGLPPGAVVTETAVVPITPSATSINNSVGTVTVESETAVATLPPTATATSTPMPTLTPTPIDGVTARVQTGGSTLWVRRSPGGQQLTLVGNGDTVLLLPGRANQGAVLWREVRTVDDLLGWLQDEFLVENDVQQ